MVIVRKFEKGHDSHNKKQNYLKVNQVVYISYLGYMPNIMTLIYAVPEIFCYKVSLDYNELKFRTRKITCVLFSCEYWMQNFKILYLMYLSRVLANE